MALTRPPQEITRRVSRLVSNNSLPVVARALGMSQTTVARLASGQNVMEGTIALAEKRFRQADSE